MNLSAYKKHRARYAGVVGLLGLALLSAFAYLSAVQRSYIFEPSSLLQTMTSRVGLKFEEVRIASGTGSERGELYSWWIPAEREDAPTLLYLHGNDKNISFVREVEYARRFHNLGYRVLMIDYRGYGKSTGGNPSEAKVYEDAESAWKYLVGQRGSPPGRTFLYGHSLGGAIAIDLAMRHPEAAGIVEESSFTSMQAMAAIRFGFTPPGFLIRERFDSLSKISQLKIPLLVIHGTWDRVVPSRMGQQLFEAAPLPKTLKLIVGGEHENSCMVGRVECRDALSAFVHQNLR